MDTHDLNQFYFCQYLVTLQFNHNARFHFFHGPALNGLLCHVLEKHPLGKEFALYPLETGHIEYRKNDSYHFIITQFKKDISFHGLLINKLNTYSEKQREKPPDENIPFRNFNLLSIKEVPSRSYTIPLPVNSRPPVMTLSFLTPLRMSKKESEEIIKKFNPSYFDIKQFLNLLYRRVYDLRKLDPYFTKSFIPPEITECTIISKNLIRIADPRKKRNRTDMGYNGVMGNVTFTMKPDRFWEQLLWLGQFTHAGNNASFGFGKYILNGYKEKEQAILKKSFITKALVPSNLVKAFLLIKSGSCQPYMHKDTVEDYANNLYENLAALTREVKNGNYLPPDLYCTISTKKRVGVNIIPAIADRILQQAVVQVIASAIRAFSHVSSNNFKTQFPHLRVNNRKKAWNDGFRYMLTKDIGILFDAVQWNLLFNKIDILFHADPVAELLKTWIMQPIQYKGLTIKRQQGLVPHSPVSRLLADLYLNEFCNILGEEYKLIHYEKGYAILCQSMEKAKKAAAKMRISIDKNANTSLHSIYEIIYGNHEVSYVLACILHAVINNVNTDNNLSSYRADSIRIPAQNWLLFVDFNNSFNRIQSPG